MLIFSPSFKRVVRDPAVHLFVYDALLEPDQVRANATMGTDSGRQISGRRPVEIDLVWTPVDPGSPDGRSVDEHIGSPYFISTPPYSRSRVTLRPEMLRPSHRSSSSTALGIRADSRTSRSRCSGC